jgi:hypothetical protein
VSDLIVQRRAVLLVPLLAPFLTIREAAASKLDPMQTMFTLPDQIPWTTRPTWPANSVASADLLSNVNQPGLYFTLIRWYPGYMSAPHKYVTDRLCVVVSGTWWINSGQDFDPASCVPVPAGTFVHRVAETWHYDGVIASGKEPVEIAICGMGPVQIAYAEPDKPGWRKV